MSRAGVRSVRSRLAIAAGVGLVCVGVAVPATGASVPGGAAPGVTVAAETDPLQSAMQALVRDPLGPPGVIVVMQEGNKVTFRTAGVANVKTGRKAAINDSIRIASMAKAFSGATALSLVKAGKLRLGQTLGELLPWTPENWADVTVRQLLQHTSGVPDFTQSESFVAAVVASPLVAPKPRVLVSYVTDEDLNFTAGSKYEYSNTDNILVGLIVQKVTGRPYATVLSNRVLKPWGLDGTELPTEVALDAPGVRGYLGPRGQRLDVTNAFAWGGWAWASGGVVSTPADLNAFIRRYVRGSDIGPRLVGIQRDWVFGKSGPPGPGVNKAGLALFRYNTECGVVLGHTGNVLGYMNFMAASPDGSKSVVVLVNTQLAHPGPAFTKLDAVRQEAVCEILS